MLLFQCYKCIGKHDLKWNAVSMLKESSMNRCISKHLCGRGIFSEFKALGLWNLKKGITCSVCDAKLKWTDTFHLSGSILRSLFLIWFYYIPPEIFILVSKSKYEVLHPIWCSKSDDVLTSENQIFQAFFYIKKIYPQIYCLPSITHPSPSIHVSWDWQEKKERG